MKKFHFYFLVLILVVVAFSAFLFSAPKAMAATDCNGSTVSKSGSNTVEWNCTAGKRCVGSMGIHDNGTFTTGETITMPLNAKDMDTSKKAAMCSLFKAIFPEKFKGMWNHINWNKGVNGRNAGWNFTIEQVDQSIDLSGLMTLAIPYFPTFLLGPPKTTETKKGFRELLTTDGRWMLYAIYNSDVAMVDHGTWSFKTASQPPPVNLTVNANPSSAGKIISGETPPKINCDPDDPVNSDCSAQFNPNESVSLTATEKSGYKFSSWSGDCSGISSSINLTMGGVDESCTANFTVNQIQPPNVAPVAKAFISTDGVTFGKSITATQGVPVSFVLSADDDADGVSYDSNGWQDSNNGVSGSGHCDWSSDFQNFQKIISGPALARNCRIGSLGSSDAITFPSVGTYTYNLKITDNQSAVSNTDSVQVIVSPPPLTCQVSLSPATLNFTTLEQVLGLDVSNNVGGVMWSSDNTSVATVWDGYTKENNGGSNTVTSHKAGSATITAVDTGLNNCSAKATIIVPAPPLPPAEGSVHLDAYLIDASDCNKTATSLSQALAGAVSLNMAGPAGSNWSGKNPPGIYDNKPIGAYTLNSASVSDSNYQPASHCGYANGINNINSFNSQTLSDKGTITFVGMIEAKPPHTYVIDPNPATKNVGETQQFNGKYDGVNIHATSDAYWGLADGTIENAVAKINSYGVATCKPLGGSATVSSTYAGINATANLTCAVVKNPTYTITPSSFSIQIGKTATFKGVYNPAGAGGNEPDQDKTSSATWSSDKTAIAEVNNPGSIYCKAIGSAAITSTYKDANNINLSDTATINCTGLPCEISASPSSLTFTTSSQTQGISVSGNRGLAIWSSSDNSVASVWDGSGDSNKITSKTSMAASAEIKIIDSGTAPVNNCSTTVPVSVVPPYVNQGSVHLDAYLIDNIASCHVSVLSNALVGAVSLNMTGPTNSGWSNIDLGVGSYERKLTGVYTLNSASVSDSNYQPASHCGYASGINNTNNLNPQTLSDKGVITFIGMIEPKTMACTLDVNPKTLTFTATGQTQTLTASGAKGEDSGILWKSNNNSVATVWDGSGKTNKITSQTSNNASTQVVVWDSSFPGETCSKSVTVNVTPVAPPAGSHKECVNKACVSVSGAGNDLCANNAVCGGGPGPGVQTCKSLTCNVGQPVITPHPNAIINPVGPVPVQSEIDGRKNVGKYTVSWSGVDLGGCANCQISGTDSFISSSTSGSQIIYNSKGTYTYTIGCGGGYYCSDTQGNQSAVSPSPVISSITVQVTQLPQCTFWPDPRAVVLPKSSTLNWKCDDVDSCSINQGIGPVGVSGSKQVSPSQTTIYILSCTGPDGNINVSAPVEVGFLPWLREILPR